MRQEHKFAEDLAGILSQIDDLKLEAKAVVDAAAEAGVNTKALRKVAREMTMEQDKREKIYEDEAQLSMFRDEVGLTQAYREAAE